MTQTDLVILLVAAAAKGAAILAAAGLVTILWRGASASARHLVWTIAVSSALLVPLLGAALTRLNGPMIQVAVSGMAASPTTEPASRDISIPHAESRAAIAGAVPRPLAPPTAAGNPSADEIGAIDAMAPVDAMIPTGDTHDAASVTAPGSDIRGMEAVIARLTDSWRELFFYLWIVGLSTALLLLAVGMVRVRLIAARGRRVDGGRWADLIARTPGTRHLVGAVTIIESNDTAMPMTWGILSPRLLVPSASDAWPDWQCRNILLHELAHVERRDCLTQLIAQVACAVYWFNPLVWIAARKMRVERELACDDRVIRAGSAPSDYASNLLDVAQSLRAPSYTSSTAIAMARPSQLSGRLLAVLDATRNRSKVSRRASTVLSAAAMSVVLPLASLTLGARTTSAANATVVTARDLAPERMAASTTRLPVATPAAAIVRALHVPDIGLLVPPDPPVKWRATAGEVVVEALAPLAVPPDAPVQAPICWDEGKGSTNISTSDDNKSSRNPSWTVRYTRDNCSLELRAEGKFTLRPDLSDIESIDSDGWFRIEERIGRNSRRMEIRRGSGGAIEHAYYVNGNRAEYSTEARAWLAQTLLAIERRTAFAASTRVPQLYRTGGIRVVLSEISAMPSDYAKSKYYSALLGMEVRLDANTLNGIVRQAASEMSSSDYYLSQVLGMFAKQPAANESTWRAFSEAAGQMKSDYYKAQALKKILAQGRRSDETVAILLKSASGIASDYYLAEVLKTVASDYAIGSGTRPYYLEALRSIESDYYRRQVLTTLNNGGEWDARTSAVILASVAEIKSDYEKSQSLISLVSANRIDNWPAFFSATTSINSDYYKRQTLEAALKRTPLTPTIVAGTLAVAPLINSDSDLASLLGMIARSYRIDENLRPAFEKAVDAIGSDHYRGVALVALRRSMTDK